MLAVWSLVPLPFLKPVWTSGSSRFTYCWSLAWRILSITSVWDECNWAVVWAFFGIAFLWDRNENWLFPVLWPLPTVCKCPSKMVGTEGGHQREDRLKPQSQTPSQSDHRATALSNSVKLSHAVWGHPRRRVMVERSDRMWSTGEGNGKPVQYSCLENPVNSVSRHGSPAHNFSPHVPTVWRARSHCPAWLSQLSVKSRVSSGCKERTTLQHTCTSSDKGQGKYVAQ